MRKIFALPKQYKFAGMAVISFFAMTSTSFSFDEFMTTSGPTSQPIGHFEFCQRLHQACEIWSDATAPVPLIPKIMAILNRVNTDVNKRIQPATDWELYGKEEFWTFPTRAGDCEDYVLLKQRELNKLGFPISTLLITVVRKPNGEGHAVLTVRTSRSDLVLDNLRDAILMWKDTEYTYLKRQSTHFTGMWTAIERRRDLFVSAANARRSHNE